MKILPRGLKVLAPMMILLAWNIGCSKSSKPAQNVQTPSTTAQTQNAQTAGPPQGPGPNGQLQPAPPPPTPPDSRMSSASGQGQPDAASGPQNGTPAQSRMPAPLPAVTVPEGSRILVRMNETIDVKHATSGERFSGTVAEPVVVGDTVAVPQGSTARGQVLVAHKRGRFKGKSVLALTLTGLEVNGTEYRIETSDLTRTKKGKGKRTAALIGGGAGLGMLVGGVASGGVGLLVGGLAGGGAGTLASAFTGNGDIKIPAESVVTFRLQNALKLKPAAQHQ
jgi:hypothetical protein